VNKLIELILQLDYSNSLWVILKQYVFRISVNYTKKTCAKVGNAK